MREASERASGKEGAERPGGLRGVWGGCGGEGRARSARVRGRGAESGRATPRPAGRKQEMPGVGVAAASRKTERGGGGAKAGETQRLCGVVATRDAWMAREGKHTLWRLRGRTRGRGRSYTLRRATRGEWREECELGCGGPGAGRKPVRPRVGPGKVPGRASSAGLAGRTRCGCARGTNAAASAGPQTEAIPRRAGSLIRSPPALPAVGATPDQVRQRGGLRSLAGAGEPGGGLGSCAGGRTLATGTRVPSRAEIGYPVPPQR